MLEHAFGFVDRVIFVIGPQNFRSRRAVEKIGATLVGSRVDESGRESVVYKLDRGGFLERPLQPSAGHD
jgi:N-acetyltransferase